MTLVIQTLSGDMFEANVCTKKTCSKHASTDNSLIMSRVKHRVSCVMREQCGVGIYSFSRVELSQGAMPC